VERIAEQVTNICERTIFLATGRMPQVKGGEVLNQTLGKSGRTQNSGRRNQKGIEDHLMGADQHNYEKT